MAIRISVDQVSGNSPASAKDGPHIAWRRGMVSPSASSRNVQNHSVEGGPGPISASESERQFQAGRGLRLFFRPKAISGLLKTAYAEWSKDKAPRMGAALAYY